MPRRKSLVTVIRELVQDEVQKAINGLLAGVGGPKRNAANGRRRRRRGSGRRGGSKTPKRRGPGRPPKAAS